MKWKSGEFEIDTTGGKIVKQGILNDLFGIDARYDDIILTHLPTGFAIGAFPTKQDAKKFAAWFDKEFDAKSFKYGDSKNLPKQQILAIKGKLREFGCYQSDYTAGAEKTDAMLAQRGKESV